jgi:uncharacterized protein (TIGR02271 family)
MARPVVGYFRDRASADRAYDDLVRGGVDRDDISIMGRGAEGRPGLADADDDVSAGQGAVTGGIFGLLLGAAAMLIPGIGPVVAIGPISAALAGALTGGVTGAVVGGITAGLVHAGVPEDEAQYYDERFREGGYLLTVNTADGREDAARQILARHGADMRSGTATGSAGSTTAHGAATTTGRERESVELREEELRARKQTVPTGEVVVRKDVVTKQESVNVPVTHEEVVVERHPVDRRPADAADFGRGHEEIRVPVREEEVRLEKQPVVTEEVTVGKRPVQETEHVSGTVRKEVARVERSGDVDVRGDVGMAGGTARNWDAVMPTYRSNWESRYGTSGGRWEDYEPSYRYGWEMRNDPRYRGRDWNTVEPELRRDWESHHNMPWDKAGRAIREAWDEVTTRR